MRKISIRVILVTVFSILPAGPIVTATAAPNIFPQRDIAADFGSPASLVVVDFNGDGKPDLLTSGWITGTPQGGVSWWENDGTGSFTRHRVNGDPPESGPAVRPADLNGDGRTDVLGDPGYTGFTWWEQTVTGDFTRRVFTLPDPPVYDFTPVSAFPADLDGDGDIDVLVSGGEFEAKSWAWWENLGGGSWAKHLIGGTYTGSTSVKAADLDGDGDLDVIVRFVGTVDKTGWVVWWEQGIDGGFTEHLAVSLGQVNDFEVADVNGDGDRDLLVAGGIGLGFAWYENDGSENFTRRAVKEGMVLPATMGAADLDGDGDLDLYGADGGNQTVLWWRNDGAGVFTEFPVGAAVNYPTALGAADFNGDGNLDLAGTIFIENKLVWWENQLPVNPGFESGSVKVPAPWRGTGLSAADGRITKRPHTGSYAFRMAGNGAGKSVSQRRSISGQAGDSFLLSAWSRSAQTDPAGGGYCVLARFLNADGSAKAYRAAFPLNGHPWTYREKTIVTTKPYTRIDISLKYAQQRGTAVFDDIRLDLK
jgi:hypothetical protein